MQSVVRLVMVGVGGYALTYLKKLLDPQCDLPVKLVGGVDPFAKNSPVYNELVAAGVPLYDTVEDFYREQEADLAIIATPIQLHAGQSIYCMEHGSDVLCEKPVCAVIDDVQRMIEARDRTGKRLAIGYQWSYSAAVQRLKQDVLSGRYGRPLRMKTIVLWPRDREYYRRGSGWAAHKKNARGEWILDSVAANATAHYLHNMLYVAGNQVDRSARVEKIKVETYRANQIEMFDTCAMRLRTAENTEMLYLVAHSIARSGARNPEFIYEFEKGTVSCKADEHMMRGVLSDGTQLLYGDPNADQTRKMAWMIATMQEKTPVLCGPEAASEHTKCINKIEELIPETPFFPAEKIKEDGELVYCEGLDAVLGRCYAEEKLPSELGVPGFGPAREGALGDYRHFAGV